MPIVFNDDKKCWEARCGSCGALNPSSWGTSTARNEDGSYAEWCGGCSGGSFAALPDVYWDGKPEENLADGPDGKPITFISRGQKAKYLAERGICEAGDRFHGAPYTSVRKEDASSRRSRMAHEVAEARRKVESMGRDARRQAILKVIKEARAHA